MEERASTVTVYYRSEALVKNVLVGIVITVGMGWFAWASWQSQDKDVHEIVGVVLGFPYALLMGYMTLASLFVLLARRPALFLTPEGLIYQSRFLLTKRVSWTDVAYIRPRNQEIYFSKFVYLDLLPGNRAKPLLSIEAKELDQNPQSLASSMETLRLAAAGIGVPAPTFDLRADA